MADVNPNSDAQQSEAAVKAESQIDQDSLETAHTLLGLSSTTSDPMQQPYSDYSVYAQWAGALTQLQQQLETSSAPPPAAQQIAFPSGSQYVPTPAPVPAHDSLQQAPAPNGNEVQQPHAASVAVHQDGPSSAVLNDNQEEATDEERATSPVEEEEEEVAGGVVVPRPLVRKPCLYFTTSLSSG